MLPRHSFLIARMCDVSDRVLNLCAGGKEAVGLCYNYARAPRWADAGAREKSVLRLLARLQCTSFWCPPGFLHSFCCVASSLTNLLSHRPPPPPTGARAEAPAGPPAATGGGPRGPAPAPTTPAPALPPAPAPAPAPARGTRTREGSLARMTMSLR